MHWNGFNGNGLLGSNPIGGYIMMGIGLVLVVVIICLLLKKGNINTGIDKESPLDLLQKKFVNGEIDEAEYTRKREILNKR